MWEEKWFRVTINHWDGGGRGDSGTAGYWKIGSWDSQALQSTLYYTQDGKKWNSVDMPLHYITGEPLKFLFNFDFVQIYGFSGSIAGRVDPQGTLLKATFLGGGVLLAKPDDDDDNHTSNSADLVVIRGRLVHDGDVPAAVRGN